MGASDPLRSARGLSPVTGDLRPPVLDGAQGKAAPADWEKPALWRPGNLICVAIGAMTFDDPSYGRVTLDVSIWRDPLDPAGYYSAMVETR